MIGFKVAEDVVEDAEVVGSGRGVGVEHCGEGDAEDEMVVGAAGELGRSKGWEREEV